MGSQRLGVVVSLAQMLNRRELILYHTCVGIVWGWPLIGPLRGRLPKFGSYPGCDAAAWFGAPVNENHAPGADLLPKGHR